MPIQLTDFERGAPFSGDADAAITSLQDRLARLQLSQIVHRKRAILLFEGWTGSGKRAALEKLAGALDPTHVRVVSVGGAEADDERHWLAPFWSRIPAAGDITIFYRSWYRRIVEERVNGQLDEKRWARACDEINEFEAQQRDHDTLVVKLFFHVTAERQAANLLERQEDPWRRHLLSQATVAGLAQRERNLEVLHDLFAHTDTRWAPWKVIDANDENAGCIDALTAVADVMEKAMPVEPPVMGETVVQFRPSRTPESNHA